MTDSVFVSVWAVRGPGRPSGHIQVTRRNSDDSEESFRYPLPDPNCSGETNIDDWARELLVQAIETL